MIFSGAALPAAYCCLEVGPLGPASGAAEGPELGYGAPGATYSFTNGPSPLGDVVETQFFSREVLGGNAANRPGCL